MTTTLFPISLGIGFLPNHVRIERNMSDETVNAPANRQSAYIDISGQSIKIFTDEGFSTSTFGHGAGGPADVISAIYLTPVRVVASPVRYHRTLG
ncbi:hypothetical protein [Sphingomonas sp. CFBP 13706]|uniref:hypothetical protein n=1 Tax=Sphingomonas sp. CFBP 13706 TaxID=2775314 RepID=UPI00177E4273|nr:hypothetical protein [Sphingomonas sp. CFBP 13706]MBD8736665.1 hypothetical protein [Sphingomonas sp. CFBP 13706]